MKFRISTYFILLTILVSSVSLNGTVFAASPFSPGIAKAAKPVCPGPAATGDTHCHAWAFPNASTSPVGLSPRL